MVAVVVVAVVVVVVVVVDVVEVEVVIVVVVVYPTTISTGFSSVVVARQAPHPHNNAKAERPQEEICGTRNDVPTNLCH